MDSISPTLPKSVVSNLNDVQAQQSYLPSNQRSVVAHGSSSETPNELSNTERSFRGVQSSINSTISSADSSGGSYLGSAGDVAPWRAGDVAPRRFSDAYRSMNSVSTASALTGSLSNGSALNRGSPSLANLIAHNSTVPTLVGPTSTVKTWASDTSTGSNSTGHTSIGPASSVASRIVNVSNSMSRATSELLLPNPILEQKTSPTSSWVNQLASAGARLISATNGWRVGIHSPLPTTRAPGVSVGSSVAGLSGTASVIPFEQFIAELTAQRQKNSVFSKIEDVSSKLSVDSLLDVARKSVAQFFELDAARTQGVQDFSASGLTEHLTFQGMVDFVKKQDSKSPSVFTSKNFKMFPNLEYFYSVRRPKMHDSGTSIDSPVKTLVHRLIDTIIGFFRPLFTPDTRIV